MAQYHNKTFSPLGRLFLTLLATVGIALPAHSIPRQAAAQATGAPSVQVEYFGPERGYVIKGADVVMLCVVRNTGNAPLPDKTLRLHCYTVDGLDYTSGETLPVLPALARNQAVAFRWRLAPSSGGLMTAAVTLEPLPVPATTTAANGEHGPSDPPSTDAADTLVPALSRMTVAVIPALPAELRMGTRDVPKNAPPAADITNSDAWLSNDRVSLRAISSDRETPLLLLNARVGTDWTPVATIFSMLEIASAENGQRPWRQTFHWRDSSAGADKDSARLTLKGVLGKLWHAEIDLQMARDTSAIRGTIRLTALRTARLYGLTMPTLLSQPDPKALPLRADGSANPVTTPDSLLPDSAHIAADRRNSITYGIAWPTSSPLPDGNWTPLPYGDAQSAPVLGATWSNPTGSVILAGATIEFSFRLFAFGPSDTIKDATRFIMP
jgi:hypothetical protein